MVKDMKTIRNFVIISHIDHGKSTLADRFLELTSTIPPEKMREQYLDLMDLEREKGITIKMQSVRMIYNNYMLNLIDTPGHVDFSYEVSRALAAVEGAILLVDATQGIQAQTLANFQLAKEQNLVIIPAVNKIDLPSAEITEVSREIENILGIRRDEILLVSAKEGTGVREVLKAVVGRIPSPKGNPNLPLQALIFDSVFDPYRGVVVYVRIINGRLKKNEKIRFLTKGKEGEALEVGYFKPNLSPTESLSAGEIGYIVTGLKSVQDARVGDTVTKSKMDQETIEPLEGYREPKPFVFASFFTTSGEPKELREALEKLQLNDSSLVFEPEKSSILGLGFRCGFLGLLHLDIIQERLEREYALDLVVTTPSVPYKVTKKDQTEIDIKTPQELPNPAEILEIKEPYLNLEIISPSKYLGLVMELTLNHRGIYKEMDYLDSKNVLLSYEIPLAEILVDFYDCLKQVSSGYASLNYKLIGFRPEKLVKLDFLVASEKIEPLSLIVPQKDSFKIGQTVVKKLKKVIPRQMFKISLQAAIGGKVIVREDIPAYRKDVTAKLYGGDVTRKRKLIDKQKKGKSKLKRFGKVEIPSDLFLKVLR